MAHAAAHAFGNRAEHHVAGIVAVLIIDRFEVVQINHQHGQRLKVALRVGEGLVGAGQ